MFLTFKHKTVFCKFIFQIDLENSYDEIFVVIPILKSNEEI
jgi:hypothetical protein